MAMVREWHESLDSMSPGRAARIREALWTLVNEWDLLTSEFPGLRELLHLVDNRMGEWKSHSRDEDCTLDETNTCTVCGVFHGDPCPSCRGRGYHRPACRESDAGKETA